MAPSCMFPCYPDDVGLTFVPVVSLLMTRACPFPRVIVQPLIWQSNQPQYNVASEGANANGAYSKQFVAGFVF